VKFLVDAQLPARLAMLLRDRGHDAIHTSDLPDGNRSTDRQVRELADAEDRVVLTKDGDFRTGHLLNGSPRRLLTIATGNISNDALLEFLSSSLPAIERAYSHSDHLELRYDALIAYPPEAR
jgi:predicted nuclease of predicted toxin-antitoxin system